MAALLETEDRDDLRILRLQRPPVNALDLELAGALLRAVSDAETDAKCSGLVLTGSAGVFSAGIDTRALPGYDETKRAEFLRAINRTLLALYGMSKPVAAAISGHALGGGLVVALAADLRLAARGDFKLGLTEAQAGVPFPAAPLCIVRAELSPGQIRALALACQTADPESPLFDGLIDDVVEPAELLDAAVRRTRDLVALPAFHRVKRQFRSSTLEQLERIVREDAEPLLRGWLSGA